MSGTYGLYTKKLRETLGPRTGYQSVVFVVFLILATTVPGTESSFSLLQGVFFALPFTIHTSSLNKPRTMK